MAIKHDPALIHGEPGSYGVVFPDLPGCTSGGATLTEAARNAAEALSFHLEGMAAARERIPEPGELRRAPARLACPGGGRGA